MEAQQTRLRKIKVKKCLCELLETNELPTFAFIHTPIKNKTTVTSCVTSALYLYPASVYLHIRMSFGQHETTSCRQQGGDRPSSGSKILVQAPRGNGDVTIVT